MNTIEIFLGRFQPIHLGHYKVIQSMKNPVIVLVRGNKTENKRNPLDAKYQEKLIRMCFPDIEVSISPNGFIPGILGYFRKQEREVSRIYAGKDRIQNYKSVLEKANENMNDSERWSPEFMETERLTSSTVIRDAIRNNDYKSFILYTPQEIWQEWETLRQCIK